MSVWSAVGLSRLVPVSDLFRRTFFRPRLRIEYREGTPCIDINRYDCGDGNGEINRKYLRLAVYNDDVQAAQNCQIVLHHIQEIDIKEGRNATVPYNTPTRLLWAGEGRGENNKGIDLAKGGPVYVDVLYAAEGKTEQYMVIRDCNNRRLLQFNKRYRFKIQGTANGAYQVIFVCDVLMKDTWQGFIVQKPESLMITSVKWKIENR
jgi:hypothetical protein